MAKELRMPNVNSTHLTGRLTRDPELRYVGQSGTAILGVDLAFNRNFKKGDNWDQVTSFIRVDVWGDKATNIAEHIKKGSPVYVEGYLEMESYTDKENRKISKMKLVANKIHSLEKHDYSEEEDDSKI